MANLKVYVVGKNYQGELGVNDGKQIIQLTKLSYSSMTKVIPFGFYYIYADNEYTQLWVCGNNRCGLTAIKQPPNNHSKASKFCNCEFFLKLLFRNVLV